MRVSVFLTHTQSKQYLFALWPLNHSYLNVNHPPKQTISCKWWDTLFWNGIFVHMKCISVSVLDMFYMTVLYAFSIWKIVKIYKYLPANKYYCYLKRTKFVLPYPILNIITRGDMIGIMASQMFSNDREAVHNHLKICA